MRVAPQLRRYSEAELVDLIRRGLARVDGDAIVPTIIGGMPAPPLSQNFDGGGGSDGTVISAANTGGGGQTAVSTTTNPTIQTFSSLQAAHGSLSMRILQTATPASTRWDWTGLGSITTSVWFRCYLRIPALPGAGTQFIFAGARTSAAALTSQLTIESDGFITMTKADATVALQGAVAVSTNQWFRVEFRVLSSTTVGECEYWLYKTMDSSTADEHLVSGSNLILGANTDQIRWGQVSNSIASYESFHDDIAVSSTGLIGPVGGGGGPFTGEPTDKPDLRGPIPQLYVTRRRPIRD